MLVCQNPSQTQGNILSPNTGRAVAADTVALLELAVTRAQAPDQATAQGNFYQILLLCKVIFTCYHCSFAKLFSHVNIAPLQSYFHMSTLQ